jgi:hypothetical protein
LSAAPARGSHDDGRRRRRATLSPRWPCHESPPRSSAARGFHEFVGRTLTHAEHAREVVNDRVIVQIGGQPPSELLRTIGIELVAKRGEV